MDIPIDCSGIYLIHFDCPFKHARHYLGWAKNIQSRIEEHKKGTGARLLAVLKENGIGWQLVRVWKGANRSEESRMKKCHNRTLLCPICGSGRKEIRRASQQAEAPKVKTLRSQKRAAARRCEEIGAQVGQKIVIRPYRSHFHQPDDIVTLTAIGMSSVLVKPKRGNEFQITEPDKIVGVYRLETLSFTFVPDKET